MMDLAQTLLFQVQGALAAAFIVFLRIGAAAAFLPVFGERVVPVRVRLVLALGFTVITAPAVIARFPELGHAPTWGRLLFTETIAGLTIGAGLRLFVVTLQMVGSMAAQATSLAQVFGGQVSDPMPAIGHIMVVSGLALASVLGLHVKIVMVLLVTYDVMPPGQFPHAGDLSSWGVDRVARAFALAFTLAAPFVVASLIYNMALGVINRAMPQLMVAFVGAPAITAGGLIILMLALPMILSVWSGAFDSFMLFPIEVAP